MDARAAKSLLRWSTSRSWRRAQAAIKRSTEERIVSPARRASLYRLTASLKIEALKGDSTLGKAFMLSRADRRRSHRGIPREPPGSRANTSPRRRARRAIRCPRVGPSGRPRSRQTCRPASAPRSTSPAPRIAPHLRDVAEPKTRASQGQDLAGLATLNEFLQGAIHGSRIRLLTREAGGLLQYVLTEHKICPFHV